MSPLSFLTIVNLSLVFMQGFYVLGRNPRRKSNILFFLICMSLVVWLVSAAFSYSAAAEEEIEEWVRVSAFGYCLLHAFTLHFVLLRTREEAVRGIILILIYGLSVLFLLVSLRRGIVFSGFERVQGSWRGVPNYGDPVFYALLAHIHLYYGICYLLLWRAIRSTKVERERKQFRIIFGTLVANVLLFNVEPFLLPLLFDTPQFIISPNFGLVWTTGIWYTVLRYGFLSINPSFVQKRVLSYIHDLVILLDPDFAIKYMNQRAVKLLGDLDTDEKAKKFLSLLVHQKYLHMMEEHRRRCRGGELQMRMHLKTNMHPIFVHAYISAVYDSLGDFLGYLVIAKEIEQLAGHLQRYQLTSREVRVVEQLLAGSSNREVAEVLEITERTVKAHVTSIYSKLMVSNKIELFTLLNEYMPQAYSIEAGEDGSGEKLSRIS